VNTQRIAKELKKFPDLWTNKTEMRKFENSEKSLSSNLLIIERSNF